MPVRPFRPADAADLADIFYRAIHEVASAHYSPAQVEAWCPERPPAERYLARGGDGRLILVATDADDRPVAYIDLEVDGHIDHMFCRPDQAGTGATAALYEALEDEARHRGLTRLYVEASEPARRFFLKHGFGIVRRHDFEVRGVPIHNYDMEKGI